MTWIIYTEKVNVKKLQPDAEDSDKEGYVLLQSGVLINIQPAGPEYSLVTPAGEMVKTYRGFTTFDGIKIGMIIERENGKRLKVVGVEEWNGPLGKHLNLTLAEEVD